MIVKTIDGCFFYLLNPLLELNCLTIQLTRVKLYILSINSIVKKESLWNLKLEKEKNIKPIKNN